MIVHCQFFSLFHLLCFPQNFSVQEFLKSEFSEEQVRTSERGQILIGGDSALVSSKMWLSWRNDLEVRSIYLTSISVNLVDRIQEEKPECLHHPISVAHSSVIGKFSWNLLGESTSN